MRNRLKRRLALSALFLVLALLLAGAAAYFWSERTAQQLGRELDPPPAIPLAAEKTLGVNADLVDLDAQELETQLSAMEAAGFSWLRHRFPWDAIEPVTGDFQWQEWDDLVEAVVRHNLDIVAVLDGSPAWARSESDRANPLAPPMELRDYGAFVSAFASRYGERIDTYQIWDEPNIAPHWGAREVDPRAYARMIREGALLVKDADPGAVILAAALAPNVEPGGANMSDQLYLDALYQAGAAEWFDVVAAQPYAFGEALDAKPDADRLNWRRIELLREVMKRHGDQATAVWAVAFGVAETGIASEGGDPSSAVTAALQSARTGWSWVGPMVWAAWLPSDHHAEYALSGAGGEPSPAGVALSAWAARPALAWPGVYPPDHASGGYEGEWRVTSQRADIGQTGDSLNIPFWGDRIDLSIRPGPYRAFLFASVDGEPANALPRDLDGRAYVVLYDPLGAQRSVSLARGLEDGPHIAQITADRGWGQWAIAGWSVSRESGVASPWVCASLLAAAVVVLSASVALAFRDRHHIRASFASLAGRCRGLDERVVIAATAGAALLLYVSVRTVPSLIALGLLGCLLFIRPQAGLVVIAFSLPFYQMGKPLAGRVFSMVELLTLVTAGAWVLNRVARSGQSPRSIEPLRKRLSAIDWGVAALVAVGAASLFWSDHMRVAAREYRTVVLEAGLFYALLRATVLGRRGAWRIADAWVLGGALIALVGVIQWIFGFDTIRTEDVSRIRAFYGSPNNLALYLGRLLPLGVALAAWGRRGWRRWAYACAAVVMLFGVVLTYSRGAWLLGVPAAILFMAALKGRRQFLIAVGAVIVALVVAVLALGPGRLLSLADVSHGTSLFRLQLWRSSWAMISDQPLTGVGLDNFLYSYRTLYVLPTAWEEFDLSHPHNLVLDFWLRLGLGGLLVLVWLLFAFFKRGWTTLRAAAMVPGDTGLLVLGLMGSIVALVAHGLVDNSVFLVDLSYSFVLALALVQVPFDVSG